MKCHLLTWSPAAEAPRLTSRRVTEALDNIPEILNWRVTTGCILIVSEEDAGTLADEIRKEIGSISFMILPIEIENVAGWTDSGTWNFVETPKAVSG